MSEAEILEVLESLRGGLVESAKAQAKAHKYIGVGSWWEQSGFASIIGKCIVRIGQHAARARRIESEHAPSQEQRA